jgi:hypothetical protein
MQYCDFKAHRLSLGKLMQKIAIKVINTVYAYSITPSIFNAIDTALSQGCSVLKPFCPEAVLWW